MAANALFADRGDNWNMIIISHIAEGEVTLKTISEFFVKNVIGKKQTKLNEVSSIHS